MTGNLGLSTKLSLTVMLEKMDLHRSPVIRAMGSIAEAHTRGWQTIWTIYRTWDSQRYVAGQDFCTSRGLIVERFGSLPSLSKKSGKRKPWKRTMATGRTASTPSIHTLERPTICGLWLMLSMIGAWCDTAQEISTHANSFSISWSTWW